MANPRASRGALKPLENFVQPGRRKTDNPMVVGTIILCLGITAIASLLQITATLWAGSQLKESMEQAKKRDDRTLERRTFLTKTAEAQAVVLRRLCLNLARDDKEKAECLTVAPPLTPSVGKESGN